MLPREKRLTRSSFAEVTKGKRAVSAHFSVTWARGAESRAAAVVSKKVAKKAVDRHLLKRRMLEAAAPHLRSGYSYILYARAGSPSLPFKTLSEEVRTLLTSLYKV